MTTQTIPNNLHIQGNVTWTGTLQKSDPSDILNQRTFAEYLIPWTSWRVWDAVHTNLPGTSANDDLALVGGTFGTDTWCIETYDVKSAGSVDLYARAFIQLPPEYQDGETVEIRIKGGMETTAADTTCEVDFEVYKSNNEGEADGSPTDLCATAAQSINNTTHANKDFTITATNLVAGDWLDIRMKITPNDASGGTEVKARIGYCALRCDTIG